VIPAFELTRPKTLEEAAQQVADGGVPYVGGTELVAAMQIGLVAPEHLVDLKSVHGLARVGVERGTLTIGSATRHREIAASPEVLEHAPMLAAACSQLGNMRVRATGSIGGNICFADSRSDVTTSLFALAAEVTLRTADGSRRIPVEDFVLGAMETDLEDGELLEAIHIPLADRHHVYLRHQPTEYPTACVAMSLERARPDGEVRFVVGAVGEIPQSFSAPSLDAIDLDAILPEVETIEDLNGTEPYKQHLAGVFITRAAQRMRQTLAEGGRR
jgi:carbon-monoxide dehydrogenase medium subunit